MKITCTKPNKTNGFKNSRITIKDDNNGIIDQFEVPAYNAIKYCEEHPIGEYGKRYAEAVAKAKESDSKMKIAFTKPNKKNGLKNAIVTIRDDNGENIDQFEVPADKNIKYLQDHPKGEYGKRYAEAVAKAEESDLQIKASNENN